ncbi:MAG: hypothetical protein KKE20_03775 [Nanoarchaeota archaeon]|nr:hypothetical protein [Nanoarchaeota archaeon]
METQSKEDQGKARFSKDPRFLKLVQAYLVENTREVAMKEVIPGHSYAVQVYDLEGKVIENVPFSGKHAFNEASAYAAKLESQGYTPVPAQEDIGTLGDVVLAMMSNN